MAYEKTVDFVDLNRYSKKWYVIAGRTTIFEKGAVDAAEAYQWNEAEKRIDINYTYKRGSFEAKVKSFPQKGWVHDHQTNAHWKVQLLWPFKADYLIIALDPNYAWVAVGVPNEKYLWIMSENPSMSEEQLQKIIAELMAKNYTVDSVKRVPQQPQ